jgi:LysM repeat protein
MYTVEPGDTLSALANEWGTSVSAIAETNGIANINYLFVGQELRIPGVGRGLTGSGGGTAAPVPISTRRYTIQPGDSLWSISIAFDTTVDDLVAANGISNPGLIRIGDTLVLP